jgi:hypothetical protein
MKAAKFIALAVVLAVPAVAAGAYKNSKVALALGFSAKEMCSCLYVTGRPEKDCAEYVDLGGEIRPRFSVDAKQKRITASLYFLLRKSATFQGDQAGCRLE